MHSAKLRSYQPPVVALTAGGMDETLIHSLGELMVPLADLEALSGRLGERQSYRSLCSQVHEVGRRRLSAERTPSHGSAI